MVFHSYQATLIATAYVTRQLITGFYLFVCQRHGAVVFLMFSAVK